MLRTRYISPFRNGALLLLLSAAILVLPGIAGSQQGSPLEGPIAFIGHGAMFDKDGNEIAPTAEFIREAQAFYLNQLLEMTDEDQRRRFEELKAELTQGRVLEGQTRLVVDSRLIEWLIRIVEHEELDRLRGKNNLMMLELNMKLPETPGHPRSLEPFELPDDLRERLIEADLAQAGTSDAILRIVTTEGGQAYRELCRENGVPIPPDWGTSEWISRGLLNDVFISADLQAEVFTFVSTAPEGMCIALPRFNTSDSIRLLGIICLGKRSAKACFWDNQTGGGQFYPQRGEVVPFSRFGGGADLVGAIGGVCTGCHAGENPYVIHPGTPLGLPVLSGLPLFADDWHEPIAQSGWPQNPGPTNLLDSIPLESGEGSCLECHGPGGAGGRFPEVSTEIRGYCGVVLRNAIQRTMPLGSPGNPNYAKHVNALLEACNQPPKSVVWVDFSHNGNESGTSSEPFNTLAEGVDAISLRGQISIRQGSSSETIRITKPLTLQAVGGTVTIGL